METNPHDGFKNNWQSFRFDRYGKNWTSCAHKVHFGFNMKIVYYDPYFKNYEIAEKFNAQTCIV